MILKLVRERKGSEFVKELTKKYRSIDDLNRLIKENPENVLYPLDLDDWLYYMAHPEDTIKTNDVIFLKDLDLKMSDLKLLDVIKKEKPNSIRNLSSIIKKDLKTVQPKVKRLENEGLLKFEHGPKNAKKPIVNFNKIEIEI